MLDAKLFEGNIESAKLSFEEIASIVHEANKAYCLGVGDLSQDSWDMLPEDKKRAAIDGVQFHIENPTANAEESHDNWMAFKLKEGWKYGTEKDDNAKLHPSLVPFKDLPESEKVKDYLFENLVRFLITLED